MSESHLTRILIVDDSRMVRASIIKHIRDKYEFREEADGEAGWQTLLLDPAIQVVISDLGMPKLDGYGLLERIRASKVSRVHNIPVIIISGDEDDAAQAKARELGATDFISKGINTVELLSRIDAAIKFAETARELEQSREALAKQSPVDPASGLATPEYLKFHAEQSLALARRNGSDLAVMVVELDGFDELTQKYGAQVTALIVRKLSKILATRVRKEDTVSQHGEAQFVIVSPGLHVDACVAFAQRLRKAIATIAMNYRGELIHISLTIGLANRQTDVSETLSQLVTLALQRVAEGSALGGNRVMAAGGELQPEDFFRSYPVSLDHALVLLRGEGADELRPRLHALVREMLPLLRLIESEYQCGIPLATLEAKSADPRQPG